MRAVIAPEPGGPAALQVVELPDPEPGPGELLVRVAAAGVNRADVLQRSGRYAPPPGASAVLGLEVAGTVEAVGPPDTLIEHPLRDRAERWAAGDRVCAVLAGGGYAELAVVPATTALPWPGGCDAVGAAAVPEVFTTVYDNVVRRARLEAGETVLFHGGSSGIGTAGIQLAKRMGCTVLVTAGSETKLTACRNLGADVAIDYGTEDFVERVAEATGGRGADVILDIVGGDYLDRNLRALAVEGRLAIIGLMGGAGAEADLGRMLTRRLAVMASTLRARSVAEKAALAAEVEAEVWPGFADSSLRAVIDRTFPLEEAAAAHERMESSAHIGKLVLTVDA
jgi:putative PIG3 family NAD(P)H quinone oxidoreductase